MNDKPEAPKPAIVPYRQVSCPYCSGRGHVTWAYGAREDETRCRWCAGRGYILTEGGEL